MIRLELREYAKLIDGVHYGFNNDLKKIEDVILPLQDGNRFRAHESYNLISDSSVVATIHKVNSPMDIGAINDRFPVPIVTGWVIYSEHRVEVKDDGITYIHN